MLGPLLAVLSAFSFSLNTVFSRRAMVTGSASQGALVTVVMGVPMFLVAALVSGQIFRVFDVSAEGYALLGVAGILHFGVGRYCNYRAVGAIGASRSQPLQAFGLPYSVAVAIVFLGESITPLMGLAIVFILVGPAIMIERRRQPARAAVAGGAVDRPGPPPAFQLRQMEGYTFGILAAMAYGTSPILIRSGLEGAPGLAVLGGLIAYASAAAVLVLISLVVPGQQSGLRAMNLAAMRLWLASGFFVFLAQMLRFLALAVAPVTVVTPLQRTNVLMTLFLSATINRRLEFINWRVVLGVVLSLAGTVVLVLAQAGVL